MSIEATESEASERAAAVTVRPPAVPALLTTVMVIVLVNVLNLMVLAGWRYGVPVLSGMGDWLLLARENNPSTWLASALFLAAAALAVVLGTLATAPAERVLRRGWWLIAAGLVLISLDETASAHEKIAPPLVEGRGLLAVLWWVTLLPVAVVAAALLWRFAATVDTAVRRGLIGAGLVYLSGAALMESAAQAWRRREDDQDLVYYVLSTVEENLELAGVLLLCVVLVGAWRRAGRPLHLTPPPSLKR